MEPTGITILNYQKKDRKTIRKISLESSILGKFRDTVFDKEILADLLTRYFTDYEPSSCFVAENENRIIGYVIGARDVRKMRRMMKKVILPSLGKRVLSAGYLFNKNNLFLLKNMLSSFIKGEFKVPNFAKDYPATLHVNITAQSRGQNVGTLLVQHFLEYLKENNVRGIHFGVLSENAKRFFLKLKFEVLFEGEYTFLYYLTGESLPHYIMGKKL